MPELPPWLTQQADPAGAFLRGAQGGAAIAQVINQRNITQSSLRLNEQQAQMNHLKMEQAIKQRDRVIKGEFVLRSLADQIEPLLAQGKPEMAMNVLLATGAREPSLFDTEGYPELLKHADAAIKTEMTRKQLESMDKLRQSQIYENNMQGDAVAEDVTPEIRQVTDPTTGKPVSLIRTGPNSWREARGGGNIDPAEAARIQLSIENLVARRRAGQLDEKKFQLSILEKIQEIETAPLLGIKPADQPAERAKRKAELLRQMRVMGITTEFVEPEGLRQGIEGQLGPVQGRPALPAPASGLAPARPSIWVPDFKSGRLIPKE